MLTGEFQEWIDRAKPGERIIYHRGDIGLDRSVDGKGTEEQRAQLSDLADYVYEEGVWERVMCLQERHGANDYSYFAVKTARKWRLFDDGEIQVD